MFLSLLAGLPLLTGCALGPNAHDEGGEDPISYLWMTCSHPYELTQDCSSLMGPRRSVEIFGLALRICGSEAGDVVFVKDHHIYGNGAPVGDAFRSKAELLRDPSKSSFDTVRLFFLAEGVAILRVRPVTSFGALFGYVLELDSDGYSVLAEHTLE